MNKAVQKFDGNGGGENRLPAHELIYRQLRDLVLFGDLAPGQAVTIQGLTDRLGAGMTPVREAIRRMIAEGALEFQGNRRVSVPLLCASGISELIVARQWLDCERWGCVASFPPHDSTRIQPPKRTSSNASHGGVL